MRLLCVIVDAITSHYLHCMNNEHEMKYYVFLSCKLFDVLYCVTICDQVCENQSYLHILYFEKY